MLVKASVKQVRMSPQKVRLVTRLISGKSFSVAEQELMFLRKGIAASVLTLLRSAVANAENNFGLDKDNLFVKEITVDAGPVFKRWRARSRGMAAQIKKPTSHISIVLAEKVPGKKKPKKTTKASTKPQVVKVKSKEEISDILKAESSQTVESSQKEAKQETGYFQKKGAVESKKGGGKGLRGAVNKFFRRKSEG
jgi:large subunit ribosomal protein L22